MIEFLGIAWPFLFSALHLTLAVSVTFHAVLFKPETGTVIAWVGLAWLAPVVGSIAYFCLGINRIQRRASALRIRSKLPEHAVPLMTQEEVAIRDDSLDANPALLGLCACPQKANQPQGRRFPGHCLLVRFATRVLLVLMFRTET